MAQNIAVWGYSNGAFHILWWQCFELAKNQCSGKFKRDESCTFLFDFIIPSPYLDYGDKK